MKEIIWIFEQNAIPLHSSTRQSVTQGGISINNNKVKRYEKN